MAPAGVSGVSGAAVGTTALSLAQLREYLLTWGIPDTRVQQRAERLAKLGVTLQGLVAAAAQPNLDVLVALLIDEGAQRTSVDALDACTIQAGAPKAAAGRSAHEAPPGVTAAALLAAPLPVVDDVNVMSSASTHQRRLAPGSVQLWEHVDPLNPEGLGSLHDAIVQHQEDADRIYGTSSVHNPRTTDMRSIDSEALLASRWDAAVAAPLTDLLCKRHPGSKAQWVQQPPSAIIQDALLFTNQSFSGQLTPAPPQTTRSGCLSSAPDAQHTASSPSSSSQCKMDFVLVLPEPSQPLPPRKRRCVCVGEVKRAQVLVAQSQSPVDLVHAWQDPADPLHTWARAVTSQVFTYMQLWKICYSFITCWLGTWLAYCPPNDRSTLYVSRPILSSQVHPAPTVRGAVAWLQEAALAHKDDAVVAHPSLMGSSAAGGGHGMNSAGDDSVDDTSLLRDAGAESGSNEEYKPSDSSSSASDGQQRGVHRKQPALAPVVHLGRKLCQGSEGAVLEGTCQGQPVIIKLLGPDESGLVAFGREAAAYRLLCCAQGRWVLRLLAACYWAAGVHAIVTARVAGTPLSSLEHISDLVAEAALHALERVHALCPGLCHGDVRLHNILLLQPQQEGAGAACMVIDFGRSRCGCTRQQQQDEVQQLASLLRLRKPSQP